MSKKQDVVPALVVLVIVIASFVAAGWIMKNTSLQDILLYSPSEPDSNVSAPPQFVQ